MVAKLKAAVCTTFIMKLFTFKHSLLQLLQLTKCYAGFRKGISISGEIISTFIITVTAIHRMLYGV